MVNIFAIAIFVLGYLAITVEHTVKMSKSAFALLTGSALWILVAVSSADNFREDLFEASSEIFGIIIFLLAAMSLVEILVHYNFFDMLRGKIFALGLDEKKQFMVIGVLSFFLSGIIDNLTTTIVMVTIARKFFSEKNLLVVVVGIVIAANAGGAFSPLGDVTTIMLWLAGKFNALEIISEGFLPSIVLAAVSLGLLYPKIKKNPDVQENNIIVSLSRSEKIVITLVFSSFIYPLLMSLIKLPPFIGLLIGLGIVWIAVDLFKQTSKRRTHMEASIDKIIQKTDIASLTFFIGILLAVAALGSLNILHDISLDIYGDQPTFQQIALGNIGLGFLSAILDNVPLTAIAIKILETNVASLWVLLALTVGTGGSLLVIGSAAGVIAMGMVKELTFWRYIKIAFVPALIGYLAAINVWYTQVLVAQLLK